MTMNEIIYRRKSCRSFTGVPVDGSMIEKLLSFELVPLYPDIKVRMEIVSRKSQNSKAYNRPGIGLLPIPGCFYEIQIIAMVSSNF